MPFFNCQNDRRKRLLSTPFPEAWLSYLANNVFLYRVLSDAEKAKLHSLLRIFIAEIVWEGCAGLKITDEIKVTMAGQACLMLLGLEDYCFDELTNILVYPGSYLAQGNDSLGIPLQPQFRLGEAWPRGPVVLSWWDARWASRGLERHNVVLHEFAHKLAELGEPQAGIPPLKEAGLAARWRMVMEIEFERLAEDTSLGKPTLLSPHGASNRAEFFAVASESFFLQPKGLRQHHAVLYQLLQQWYNQDPSQWKVENEVLAEARHAEEEYAKHAVAECNAALRLQSDYLEAYRRRAAYSSFLKEFPQALADCAKIIQLASGEEKYMAHYERGRVHLEAGLFKEAVADFSEAIRGCNGLAQAYCGRAAAYTFQGDIEKALNELSLALRLDSDHFAAYLQRGKVYCQVGDHGKALEDLGRAITLAPEGGEAYSERAYVYNLKGRFAKAIADCDEAICLEPRMAKPYKQRGLAHFHLGKLEPALADLGQAILIDPDDVETYRARAEVFLAQGKKADAEGDLEKVQRIEARKG